MKLGQLRRGDRGVIVNVGEPEEALTRRFMEMGLLEGCKVELVHEAPFGGDPIAVRVRGALVAIRRQEANQIEIEVEVEVQI